MNKKVVILGGGTGLSTLLRGLKKFPLDITAIVSVCDDGRSTGRLREEFNVPAVGDIRKVLVSLSETEPLIEKLLNYRFNTTSDLNGHTVGNLLLTALSDISGNISDGIETLGKVFNLKGKVLPLTEDYVTLMGKMEDDSIIQGEHNITEVPKKIIDVFYKETPTINPKAIQAIQEADLIILSMGSIFTSIIPNLICPEIIEAIDNSKASIMYTCNMMTQPGETDNFKASDHIKLLNNYLGKRKIDVIISNNGPISKSYRDKYATLEQKEAVIFDKRELQKLGLKVIASNFVIVEDDVLRHNSIKLSSYIFSYTL
ncbi:MAG: uridine diphosphate-N-acetylglucosamine-binding protein YvcK [Bacilli bacterium]